MIIKSNPEEFQDYLSDAANFKGECQKVFFPESNEDILLIVNEANEKSIPISIAGNRTGLTGSSVPLSGYVIATNNLNKIIEINKENKFAIVEPGVLLSEFQAKIKEAGLFYPPDPTETNCFMGGTIATNASGAKSFKFGPTRNFVEMLEVILATGEILTLIRGENKVQNGMLNLITDNGTAIELEIPSIKSPKTKNAAGYYLTQHLDAIDLFIGSEGTLGLITKIKLRLIDPPQNIFSTVLFFEDELKALQFVKSARGKSKDQNQLLDALGLEFFDKRALNFLSKAYPNIPTSANSAVWIEQSYTDDSAEDVFGSWIELADKFDADIDNSWSAMTDSERAKFVDFRHAISWKINEYITQKGLHKVGTDTAVPEDQFEIFYHFAQKIVTQNKLEFVTYGHFGDCHIHLNMLPKNSEELKTAKKLYGVICRKAVELGGTISAEHGIGKLKRDYFMEMYGEDVIRQMAKLKRALDPNGILSPGNIFDEKYLVNND